MKAAVLHERGGVPRLEDFRDPDPDGPDPVLDVLVAALNPIDLSIAAGKVPAREREHPSVPGTEGVGELEGKAYYFDTAVAPFGSLAERVAAKQESLMAVPAGLDPALAVCFGVAGLAAWLALTWRGGLEEGETVLVLGASGVVGQIAVQGARLLGAGRVVAAARDGASLDRARTELGADAVVQLGGDGDLTKHLKEAAGGGYDLVIDPLWGEPAVAALAALNDDGRLVAIGNSAGETAAIDGRDFRNRLARVIGHTNFKAPRERKREAFEAQCAHALAGQLKVPVEERPLADVAAVWEAQGGSPHAKQVLRVR
jgi:NADPH:quinone reductase-like Zn-dependent oxidoreductase